MAKHTKESIIESLRNLSHKLGTTRLSKQQIGTVIPPSALRNHFGSIGEALEAAGLDRTKPEDHFRGRGPMIADTDLFESLREVEHALGRIPTSNQYGARGRYSTKPFRKRFGKWADVVAKYERWRAETPHTQGASQLGPAGAEGETPDRLPKTIQKVRRTPEQLFGEPIDFRGLRHAPINEQGVVFLFGMISRELGFNIEAVQQGFPDCEGKYLYDPRKSLWAKARIEFEYRASTFKEHGHNSDSCDFIVCWINDWLDCPIEVIELRSEIQKLPRR